MKKTTYLFIILLFILIAFPIYFNQVKAIEVSNATVTEGNGRLSIQGANPIGTVDVDKTTDAQNTYMEKRYNRYITVLAFISAMAAVTMLAIFIKHIVTFASLGTEHWILRRKAMFGLLWSGIATALLGSATLIMALSYNAFKF